MAVEPYTVAAFVVSTASLVTAGEATAAAKYVREARENSEQALRVLRGEDGIEDGGLLNDVEEHRKALLAAGLYPPPTYRGGAVAKDDDDGHVGGAD